jgi:hypothetical protein
MSRKQHRPEELSERAKSFIREFAVCCDIKLAQSRASPPYTQNAGNGRKILNDPRAQKMLRAAVKRADEMAGVHLAWTLANLKKIAEANVIDVIKIDPTDGSFRVDLSKLTPEQAYAIAEVGFDSDGRPKLKFHDKTVANKALLDYLKPEKPQAARVTRIDSPAGSVEIIEGLGERLNAARARRAQRQIGSEPTRVIEHQPNASAA